MDSAVQLLIRLGKDFLCKCHLTVFIHPWTSIAVTIHHAVNDICLSVLVHQEFL